MRKNEKTTMIVFVVLEILIIIFIFLSTFDSRVRNSILGKIIDSREQARKKGYGFYSDPDIGPCLSYTGDCSTPGSRLNIKRCIPNFSNGDYGVGCLDQDGLITYNMIVEEQTCKQTCFSNYFDLQDNVTTEKSSGGSNVVTSYGTHQIIDRYTGDVMTDYFIGDLDRETMKYTMKNCISDQNRFIGFKEKRYTCKNGIQNGVKGCIYSCGVDPTLNYGSGVSKDTNEILAMIHFPYYEDENGKKIFVCKDIEDNNSVEILNHGGVVPKNFSFPDKCYNHVNVTDTEESELLYQDVVLFGEKSQYIYTSKTSKDLSPFFSLDYNLLSDQSTYVKMYINYERMLLGRYYDCTGSITSITDDDDFTCYIPVSDKYYTREDVSNSVNIFLFGPSKTYQIPIIQNVSGTNTVLVERGFFMIPVYMIKDWLSQDGQKTGTYLNDYSAGSIRLKSPSFVPKTRYFIFCKFDSEWIPEFFPIETDASGTTTISTNSQNLSGDFSFYMIAYGQYSIVLGAAGPPSSTLNIYPTEIPITGCMFVDTFNLENTSDTIQNIGIRVDLKATFYIYGTPLSNNPHAGEIGYYYPLSQSQVNSSIDYTVIEFEEYSGQTFYIPTVQGYYAQKNISGSWNSYDYLSGVSNVLLRVNNTTIESSTVLSYYHSPVLLDRGNNYSSSTYYTIENNIIKIQSVVTEGSVLEVYRSGDEQLNNFEIGRVLDNVERKSYTENTSTEIRIEPEKILNTERDFTNFKGPYTQNNEGERDFLCTDDRGIPLKDGTKVDIPIGETLIALIPDNNFNTNVDPVCGNVYLNNKSQCRVDRNSDDFLVSDSCQTFNPDGNYHAVENFLENGYLVSDDNKLECYVDGQKVDDSRCRKSFLTDYEDDQKVYDVGEELLLNRGDITTYISLQDGNDSIPTQDSWASVSTEGRTYYNVGQYMGTDQTYKVTQPGWIYNLPENQNDYLTLLRYRTDSEYQNTNSVVSANFTTFKNSFNVVTPYLISDKNNDIKFFLTNSDFTTPVIKVSLPSLVGKKGKVFLEENYMNILIWFLSSYNFLSNTVVTSTNMFYDLKYINFSSLDDTNPNSNIDLFNSTKTTSLPLFNTQQKENLTGYYCYFIPMVCVDQFTSRVKYDSLFPFQWGNYIHAYYNSNRKNYPCKFEVVYVTDLDSNNNITFERNITNIPKEEIFRFISIPQIQPAQVAAFFGLFLPISKTGPFPRIHDIDPADGSFNITFNIPTNYFSLIQQLSDTPPGGEIDVYGGESKTDSFFNYGYSGFVFKDNVTSPNYSFNGSTLVYNGRTSGSSVMAYVKRIRVTSEGSIYMDHIEADSVLVYAEGDVITIEGYRFNVIAIRPVVSQDSTKYEKFDYQIGALDNTFITNYNNGQFFSGYVNYNKTDRLLPSIYSKSGNAYPVVQEIYDISQDSTIASLVYTQDNPVKTTSTYSTDSNVADTSVRFFPDFGSSPGDLYQTYTRFVNQGKASLSVLHQKTISEGVNITVTSTIGQPYGILSNKNGISDTYTDVLASSSQIETMTGTGLDEISVGEFVIKDGYSFSKVSTDIGSVDMIYKSYTTDINQYVDVTKKYLLADIVTFKNYINSITYRNQGQNPIPFNIGKDWVSYGEVNPRVDYKLYHQDQIYSSGDIVKYNGELWKTKTKIGITEKTRLVPSLDQERWGLYTPSGDLFSQSNYFAAALQDLDSTNTTISITIQSIGDVHIFPQQEFLFNRTYDMDTSTLPILYFSSNGVLMSDKYNYTDNGYVLELRYYLDGVEVSQSNYISQATNTKSTKISMLLRRGQNSLFSVDTHDEQNIIRYGDTTSTDGGSLYFLNNGLDLSVDVSMLNKIDDQNIPIRMGNYGSLGYCFDSCVANISNSYNTNPFGFINLISSGLVNDYFNNRIRIFKNSNSFVSLGSQPCNQKSTASDRYLSACTGSSDEGSKKYSQYVFQLPNLDRNSYGVPFCGSEDSLIYANSLFFLFTPMDIDSQNFLKYTVVSAGIAKAKYLRFHDPGGTINVPQSDSILLSTDGSYSVPTSDLTLDVGDNQTRLLLNSFNKEIIFQGPVTLTDSSNNQVVMTPSSYNITIDNFSIPSADASDIANYSDWWLLNSDGSFLCHGYVYNPGGKTLTWDYLFSLSYIQDLYNRVPNQAILYIKGSSKTYGYNLDNNNIFVGVADFKLEKLQNFSLTSTNTQFSGSGFTVSVHFDGAGRMFQHGEYSFTGDPTEGQIVYHKYKGDRCICKCYLNWGNNNGLLSFQNDKPDAETLPLIFNRNNPGLLSLKEGNISLLSGDDLIETSSFLSTFVIETSGSTSSLLPNYMDKPFNLSEYSVIFPNVMDSDIGVISSNQSSVLETTTLDQFSISDEGDAIDYLKSLDGEEQNYYITNSEMENLSYRQNISRQNYPDSKYECNFILGKSSFSGIQKKYELVTNSTGQIFVIDGEKSITMRTNTYYSLIQDDKAPIEFLVSGKVISEKQTNYSNEQYLIIEYYLNNNQVSKTTYDDIDTFRKSTSRYVIIIFQTKLDSDQTPSITTIDTRNSASLSDSVTINIIENN